MILYLLLKMEHLNKNLMKYSIKTLASFDFKVGFFATKMAHFSVCLAKAPRVWFEQTSYWFIPTFATLITLRRKYYIFSWRSAGRLFETYVSLGLRQVTGIERRTKKTHQNVCLVLAPRVWFEQTTYRLTAGCSTAELTRNTLFFKSILILANTKLFVNYFLKNIFCIFNVFIFYV